jgi:hypothetical protein
LLGCKWICSVYLLSDFGNQKYYILIPLAVKVAKEKFPSIVDAEAEAKDIKPVNIAMSNKIAKEYNNNEFCKADYGDDYFNG